MLERLPVAVSKSIAVKELRGIKVLVIEESKKEQFHHNLPAQSGGGLRWNTKKCVPGF
jgi:hypothetical protein